MKNNILNTGLFRLTFPLFFGMMVYILVLVFFGSASQILENFFSQEALVCIAITFIMNELLLLLHKLANKTSYSQKKLFNYLLVIVSLLVSCGVVTLLISLYFEHILELSKYKRELLIFNTIYGVSSILYSLVWIGIQFIRKQSNIVLQKEKIIEANLNQEFKELIYNTEPELFYSTLEYILSLLKTNQDEADEYLTKLSNLYRNKLEMKDLELVALEKEIETSKLLIDLLNIKHNQNIKIEVKIDDLGKYKIKPFSITEVLKITEKQTIINSLKPLKFVINDKDNFLYLQFPKNPKLNREENTDHTQISSEIKFTLHKA